jgi:hypothetical protein
MANCVRCVVKQTFGWQRRQIFPDRYLSGKRPETLQSLPTYGPNIGTTTNIFLCKWPWAEPTITPKALKLSALLDKAGSEAEMKLRAITATFDAVMGVPIGVSTNARP